MTEKTNNQLHISVHYKREQGEEDKYICDDAAGNIIVETLENLKLMEKLMSIGPKEKGIRLSQKDISVTVLHEREKIGTLLADHIRVRGDIIGDVLIGIEITNVYDSKVQDIPLPKPNLKYNKSPSESVITNPTTTSDTFVGHGDTIVSKKPIEKQAPPFKSSEAAADEALKKMRYISQMNAIDKNKKQ